MTDRVRHLDGDTTDTGDRDTHERLRAHHRDVIRDLVIVALSNALGDEGFTHGPWLDNSHHDASDSLIPFMFDPGDAEQCQIVSPTRRFTLYIDDTCDNLVGINDQGEAILYNLDELLDSGILVQ